MMTREHVISALVSVALFQMAQGQTYVGFDAAMASNTNSAEHLVAERAMSSGSGYWCSSGQHPAGQSVTWTGMLNSRHKVVGVKINWAYAPGEFALLTSRDGGNFEEIVRWQTPGQKDASFVESVMFDTVQNVKALTIAMRNPMPWQYFGINEVSLIVEPYPFMIVSGARTSSGELCLVAQGAGLGTEPCLSAIAAGDGREVFKLNDVDQLVNVGTSKCVTFVNADAPARGKMALETCAHAAEAEDGRSNWAMTSAGQLAMTSSGGRCLDASGTYPAVQACADEKMGGNDKLSFVAVPEFDTGTSTAARNAAILLKAAAARQGALLDNLQEATKLIQTCSPTANLKSNSSVIAGPAVLLNFVGAHSAPATDAAMQAIRQIYAAGDVDMQRVGAVIMESAQALKAARGKLAR